MMQYQYPNARHQQTIGLFGGSFDPAHQGHMHLTLEALKRCEFDQIWWLVSPSNPLKVNTPKAISHRVSYARDHFQHPKIKICDIESKLETRFTADTISVLQHRYPATRFTWLMGADSLVNFHKWDRWQQIISSVPVAVFARPASRLSALNSKAARIYRSAMVNAHAAKTLRFQDAPAWCFNNMPMKTISSSEIRAQTQW